MDKDEDYSAIADPGLARWLEKTRYQDEWQGYRNGEHSTTVETKGIVRRWNLVRTLGIIIAGIALPVAWIFPAVVGPELTTLNWIHAICASIFIPWMVANARKEFGKKPEFIIFLLFLLLFPGLFNSINLMIIIIDWNKIDFADMFQVLSIIKYFFQTPALLTCFGLVWCTDARPRETKWIDTRLKAMQARIDSIWRERDEGVKRSDIDATYRELVSISADARFLDHEIDTKVLFSKLRDLSDRCKLQQTLGRLQDLRVSTLRAATGIDEQVFASMILEMCTRFDLIIDGDMIKRKDERDMNALITEIEGFFDQWRNSQVSKLGEIKTLTIKMVNLGQEAKD